MGRPVGAGVAWIAAAVLSACGQAEPPPVPATAPNQPVAPVAPDLGQARFQICEFTGRWFQHFLVLIPDEGRRAYQFFSQDDDLNRCRTVPDLSPGRWTASVVAFGSQSWMPLDVPFVVESGLTTEVRIQLRPGRIVRGRVAGPRKPGRHTVCVEWPYPRSHVPPMQSYGGGTVSLPEELDPPPQGCLGESLRGLVWASGWGYVVEIDVREDGVFGLVGLPRADLRLTLEHEGMPVAGVLLPAGADTCTISMPEPPPACTIWFSAIEQQGARRWAFHVRADAEDPTRSILVDGRFAQFTDLAPGPASVFAVGGALGGELQCAYQRTTRSGRQSDLCLGPERPGRVQVERAVTSDDAAVDGLVVTPLDGDVTLEIPGADRTLSPDGISGPLPANRNLILRFSAPGCEPTDIPVRLDAGKTRDLGQLRLRPR